MDPNAHPPDHPSQHLSTTSLQKLSITTPNTLSPQRYLQEHGQLDFSGLFPTPQQIDTFQAPSTGATPTQSPRDSMDIPHEDAYTPLVSLSEAPLLFQSEGTRALIKWIDTLFNGMAPNRPLTLRDYDTWRYFLHDPEFKHEEYREALLHAVKKLIQSHQLLYAQPAPISTEAGKSGISIGHPYTILLWQDVTSERVKRMTTMAIRTGILQACIKLRELESGIAQCSQQGKQQSTPQGGGQSVQHTGHRLGKGRGTGDLIVRNMAGRLSAEDFEMDEK